VCWSCVGPGVYLPTCDDFPFQSAQCKELLALGDRLTKILFCRRFAVASERALGLDSFGAAVVLQPHGFARYPLDVPDHGAVWVRAAQAEATRDPRTRAMFSMPRRPRDRTHALWFKRARALGDLA